MQNTDTQKQIFDSIKRQKINISAAVFVSLLAVLTVFAGIASAQTTVNTPPPTPRATPNPTSSPSRPTTTPKIYQVPTVPTYGRNPKQVNNESGFPAEKSIEVDEKVNISLKVCNGDIKVNGWDRNEIRAYVKGGSEVGFKVTQKNPSNGKPVYLYVVGYDPQKNKQIGIDSCLSGEEIELDVPHGATGFIKAGESDITVESVKKAIVTNERGDIWLNDISQGVNAQTFDGDITVENSKGNIKLTSTSGNILGFNLDPVEVGDLLSAKSSGGGAITLQSVRHSVVESNSTSGMIKLISNIVSGGQYKLVTNGAILLVIPSQSSLIINAIYGNFQTEIPANIDNVSRTPNSPLQTRTVQIGSGDAMVNLQTSGIIKIKKSN